MSCARTRRSVGPLRWTWPSTCSTACWSWDARTTSAWPNPVRVGVSAPASLIHATQPCDEGSEVLVRFLATERNALEALELAHKLLDTGAGAIERLREERRPVLGR